MGKYFFLQVKRFLRIFPFTATISTVLLCALLIVFHQVIGTVTKQDMQTKVSIGIVGESEDSFLDMALQILQSMDSSRFAIEMVSMDEASAVKALEQGSVGAYVVIPEGFIEEALQGRVKTVQFVSTAGAAGLVSMLKNEITAVISDMVLACQKGMFGMEAAFLENGAINHYEDHVENLTLTYAEFVLIRSQMYQIEELGVTGELDIVERIFCGILVLFLTLSVLPFSQLLIKRDFSVEQVLLSKGRNVISQVICEFGAFFLCYTLQLILSCTVIMVGAKLFGISVNDLLKGNMLHHTLPLFGVVFLITAFGYVMYSISSDIVSGVLLQFFAGVFLCFICGCMYPINFFPEIIQNASVFLPQGIARSFVEAWLTGAGTYNWLWLLAYSVLFPLASVVFKKHRVWEALR